MTTPKMRPWYIYLCPAQVEAIDEFIARQSVKITFFEFVRKAVDEELERPGRKLLTASGGEPPELHVPTYPMIIKPIFVTDAVQSQLVIVAEVDDRPSTAAVVRQAIHTYLDIHS